MGTITALRSTVLKLRNIDSTELLPVEKFSELEGVELAVERVRDEKNQSALVTFTDAIASHKDWYIFRPHWKIPLEVQPRDIKLGVKYRTQIGNAENLFGTGYRQCNITTHTMALNYCLRRYGLKDLDTMARERGLSEGEDVYGKVLAKYGDTIYHAAHTSALKEFGVESYFSYTLSIADVLHCLENLMPVPLAVSYKTSGHVLLVVGYEVEKKMFYCHDPYGCRAGSADYYQNIGDGYGAYDQYSLDVFAEIWGKSGDSQAGWGRVITSVNNVATGCENNL